MLRFHVEEGRLEAVRNGTARGAAELRPHEFISQYNVWQASRQQLTDHLRLSVSRSPN